jgi:phosphatidylglycerophosphatase A
MNLNRLVATAGGLGYFPLAPGTWAAAAGVLLWFAIFYFTGSNYWQAPLIITCVFTGVYVSGKLINEYGKDPQIIVIDELAGIWITLFLIPFSITYFITGFILFRFFDIVKPLGIKGAEKFNGGWGVMLDDILAGVYSNIVLQLIVYYGVW